MGAVLAGSAVRHKEESAGVAPTFLDSGMPGIIQCNHINRCPASVLARSVKRNVPRCIKSLLLAACMLASCADKASAVNGCARTAV